MIKSEWSINIITDCAYRLSNQIWSGRIRSIEVWLVGSMLKKIWRLRQFRFIFLLFYIEVIDRMQPL